MKDIKHPEPRLEYPAFSFNCRLFDNSIIRSELSTLIVKTALGGVDGQDG